MQNKIIMKTTPTTQYQAIKAGCIIDLQADVNKERKATNTALGVPHFKYAVQTVTW